MKIHIVKKGDTLWKLAEKYGVDFEELKQVNNQLENPDMLMPGMKIKIPTGSVPAKKNPGHHKKAAPIAKEAPMPKEAPMMQPAAKELPKVAPIAEAKPELKKLLKGVSLSELKDLLKELKPDWTINIDIVNQEATIIEQKITQKMPAKEIKPFTPPPPAPKAVMPMPYQPKEQPIYHQPVKEPCPPYPPSHVGPFGGHKWHSGKPMPAYMPTQAPYSYPSAYGTPGGYGVMPVQPIDEAGAFPGGFPSGATPGGAFPGGFPPGATPGGVFPGGFPTGATPGGAFPGGFPSGATPGGAFPGGFPSGATPGGAFPGGFQTGATPGGAFPGGFQTGATPGGAFPGGFPPGATPGGAFPGTTPAGMSGVQPGSMGQFPTQMPGSPYGYPTGEFGTHMTSPAWPYIREDGEAADQDHLDA